MKVICGLSKSKFKEKLKPLRAVFMKMVLRYKAGCDVCIRRAAQSQATYKDKNATAELHHDADRAKLASAKISSARTMELWIEGGKKDMTADDGTIYRCLDGPLRAGITETRKTSPKPKTKKKQNELSRSPQQSGETTSSLASYLVRKTATLMSTLWQSPCLTA